MAKAEKKDVDYSLGMAESHCGKVFEDDKSYCRFFSKMRYPAGPGECEKVSGEINPVFWCKLFSKAD